MIEVDPRRAAAPSVPTVRWRPIQFRRAAPRLPNSLRADRRRGRFYRSHCHLRRSHQSRFQRSRRHLQSMAVGRRRFRRRPAGRHHDHDCHFRFPEVREAVARPAYLLPPTVRNGCCLRRRFPSHPELWAEERPHLRRPTISRRVRCHLVLCRNRFPSLPGKAEAQPQRSHLRSALHLNRHGRKRHPPRQTSLVEEERSRNRRNPAR